MATVVRMPAALAGVTEGAIQSWLTQVGQTVAVGDPIAEIETEKAVVEYAAETAGTVGQLLVEPGANIPVGTPIAVILAEGESDSDAGSALAAAGVPATTDAPAAPEPETSPPTKEPVVESAAASPSSSSTSSSSSVASGDGGSSSTSSASASDEAVPAVPHLDEAAQSSPPASPSTSSQDGSGRAFVSPIVRRLARERGLDLSGVTGSGPGGRIVRRDIDGLEAPAASAPSAASVASAPAPSSTPAPGAGAVAGAEKAEATQVPLTGMRRAIARRLTESKTTVPHFYVTAHCRVDKLLALRAEVNAIAPRKVSVNDFVLKAVAGALIRVPASNAIWGGDHITTFGSADIAVAVAVEGGLLTPVLRGVDRRGIVDIAAAVAEVAERARAGKIQQHELEGGSFAVSNLGMYGVDEFSAILNPPQSGILAVGAAKKRPVVSESGELEVGTVMTVTLSADHRVIDGAVAAEWMAAFVKLIENPVGALL